MPFPGIVSRQTCFWAAECTIVIVSLILFKTLKVAGDPLVQEVFRYRRDTIIGIGVLSTNNVTHKKDKKKIFGMESEAG